MNFEHILYDVDDRISTITLNRPENLNAWTPTMMSDMLRALDAADADDDVRVVMLS